MNSSNGNSFAIPWAPLVALAATVAGLSTLLPSRSARPPATTTEASVPGGKGISARLWQDPLQVAKEAELRQRKEGIMQPAETWEELHSKFLAFSRASPEAAAPGDHAPLVLIACFPDSPYAEDVERRLRDRAALHYALSAEGYFPSESTTLHYVMAEPGREGVAAREEKTAPPTSSYPLPFEWFTPLPGKEERKILLIWVGDGYLGTRPLHGVAEILNRLSNNAPPLEARVLGPSSSGKYRQTLEEIGREQKNPDSSMKKLGDALARTQIYSCKATGAEPLLRTGLPWLAAEEGKSTGEAIRDALRLPTPGSQFDFIRTVATDEDFCNTLRQELAERRIGPEEHLAVITELDSIYGRNSTKTFVAWQPPSKDRSGQRGSFDYDKARPQNLHTFTYRAGIDGALPKNALGLEERETKERGAAKSETATLQEASEGQSQVDYFRRLAEALVAENARLIQEGGEEKDGQKKGGQGFKAVAVLGSDIYDKLQILRTLHSRLPGAIFLTNGLDARFGHPDEWAETRNLLAAASYPLKADFAGETPPFRDSTQVAVYAAARQALQPDNAGGSKQWKGRSRLFEIGKSGPIELSTHAEPKPLPKGPRWLSLAAALGAFLLMAFLLSRHSVTHSELRPSGRFAMVGYCLSRSGVAIPGAILLSGLVTAFRYRFQDLGSVEPFAFYDGISIWPGDFLRLLVVLLAIHFVLKILWDLNVDAHELRDQFGLGDSQVLTPPAATPSASQPTSESAPAPVAAVVQTNPPASESIPAPATTVAQPSPSPADSSLSFLKSLWPHCENAAPGKVDVLALFQRYCAWSTPWQRALRALFILILYLVLIFAIFQAFPSTKPFLPVRGNAWLGSQITLWLAILGTLYVTFLVVDATAINCCFIRDLNRDRTYWHLSSERLTGTKFAYFRHLSVLEPTDCADLLDIHYIARRSSTVNKLVYFPFLLIGLMVAARWSQTDGYTWPPMLVVVFALNASWAAYCAIRLPIEARAAREACLQRLRDRLFQRRAEEAVITSQPKALKSNSVALTAVIEEIEKLREGAFVGIWDQPLLRAILVPSGGVGLWALWDFLPH